MLNLTFTLTAPGKHTISYAGWLLGTLTEGVFSVQGCQYPVRKGKDLYLALSRAIQVIAPVAGQEQGLLLDLKEILVSKGTPPAQVQT